MELLGIFIAHPWLALIVAGLFILLWWRIRSKLALAGAAVWASYAGYEYLMFARVLCTGECNIRVDLLFLYPLLLLMSAVAVIHGIILARKAKRCAAVLAPAVRA
ncbi:hypothetical protein GCM10008101_28400 [Lysobacter xinjiangensis]|uniref:Lycopene cyclase domain-containing protein n=1 Tax=Cognatilysobacter xinjiangensis TaxID=546892 RepID=A0ABQ3CAL7_9GAMM|nr:hypothetical protein GCM10008101_28400 [Lysobacter xinjiangensis]